MPEPTISVAARTDVGRTRQHNEDSLLTWTPPPGTRSPLGVTAVLAVADGMGGHEAGDEASRLAVRCLERVLCATAGLPELETAEELEAYLDEVFRWINEQVHALGQGGDTTRPGTTLTTAAVRGDRYVVGHVGDSRAYLWRDCRLTALTEDHSYVAEEVKAGRLTPAAARTSPFRGNLTRCLGVRPEVEPAVAIYDARDGDVLVLCSDGLSEYLTDEELSSALRRHNELDGLAEQAVQLALHRGGEDNVTVVACRLGEPRPVAVGPELTPTERQADTYVLPAVAVLGRSRAPRWATLIALFVCSVMIGFAIGWMRQPPARQADPTTASTAKEPTDEVLPGEERPAPPSPAIVTVTLQITAQAKDVSIAGAKGRLQVTAARERYTPERRKDAWRVTLRSTAAGQPFRLVDAHGQSVREVQEGLAEGKPLDVVLEPGDYLMELSGVPVVDLAVAPLKAAAAASSRPLPARQ